MSRRGWKVVVAGVVAAAAWGMARRGGPEERLAGRYQELCRIAGDNVKTPSRGVDRMGLFFATRGPDMLHDYGALVAEIERIRDDARHDERAREAGRTLRAPLDACGETFQRFADAVEADDEANAKATRAIERLSRTLQLLFGDLDSRELRHVVARLTSAR